MLPPLTPPLPLPTAPRCATCRFYTAPSDATARQGQCDNPGAHVLIYPGGLWEELQARLAVLSGNHHVRVLVPDGWGCAAHLPRLDREE